MPDVPTSDPEQFCQGAPLLLVTDVRAVPTGPVPVEFGTSPSAIRRRWWWCVGRIGI